VSDGPRPQERGERHDTIYRFSADLRPDQRITLARRRYWANRRLAHDPRIPW